MGMAYQHNYQYPEASKHYAAFKIKNKKLSAVANEKITECSVADSLYRQHTKVEIRNLGVNINGPFAEFGPILSRDGQTMIFTSNRTQDEYEMKSRTNFEDIYVVRKAGGQWEAPQSIGADVNTKFNDAAGSLSNDGNTLFLYYEQGKGDIYASKFENGQWTKPLPLNKFINNPLYKETSACMSADGKKLYFASNRAGGKGGLDIYVSALDAKGQWGRPANLGSKVNTRGNEDAPFIHRDGTLYFSSDGHPNLGRYDVFKSEFKNGKFTTPENLGYPINSSDDDGFFVLTDDGKTGYYSATREDGLGDSDIFSIRFESADTHDGALASTKTGEFKTGFEGAAVAGPEKNVVTKLRGKVIDVASSLPLVATVRLMDNSANRLITKITSDASGNFELHIPHGGNYGVITEKAGYLFNSINFNVPPFAGYQEVDTHILMEKPAVGSKVVLKNIFFDVGKSDLKSESLGELENIRAFLLGNAQLRVQINGHTDNTGHEAANLSLSLKRAQAVTDYLVKQGIASSRLEAKGYGSGKPLVSNDDEAGGRQINRRTEIEIIKSVEAQ
jgi:outer membrane protein OmpA-like peptidoglycan-associated protein